MIYVLLCREFFKIGLFAVGGGLVTVPFLFDLSETYEWFSATELADMIAVSQSTPGPIGINMATYAGFQAAGIGGALAATLSEVLPSMIVVYFISHLLNKWAENRYVNSIFSGIRPAVMALILFAGWDIAKTSITDIKTLAILLVLTLLMHFYKKNAIFYIVISAIIGLLCKL
ncbi:MAG: chromate transporter [Alphaproteobacteria bacterium]|nr:chromate transporter [Alphaproteobacteria bacterium]